MDASGGNKLGKFVSVGRFVLKTILGGAVLGVVGAVGFLSQFFQGTPTGSGQNTIGEGNKNIDTALGRLFSVKGAHADVINSDSGSGGDGCYSMPSSSSASASASGQSGSGSGGSGSGGSG